MVNPSPHWCILFKHLIDCAFCLAADKAGSSIAARIAIMAITTNNSINVNAANGFGAT